MDRLGHALALLGIAGLVFIVAFTWLMAGAEEYED